MKKLFVLIILICLVGTTIILYMVVNSQKEKLSAPLIEITDRFEEIDWQNQISKRNEMFNFFGLYIEKAVEIFGSEGIFMFKYFSDQEKGEIFKDLITRIHHCRKLLYKNEKLANGYIQKAIGDVVSIMDSQLKRLGSRESNNDVIDRITLKWQETEKLNMYFTQKELDERRRQLYKEVPKTPTKDPPRMSVEEKSSNLAANQQSPTLMIPTKFVKQKIRTQIPWDKISDYLNQELDIVLQNGKSLKVKIQKVFPDRLSLQVVFESGIMATTLKKSKIKSIFIVKEKVVVEKQ